MLQSLAVISVNIWDILISFANLIILFLIVKKFLFKPVKNIMKKRQSEIDMHYKNAEENENRAKAEKDAWTNKMKKVNDEANSILEEASENAKSRGDKIISDAKQRAEGIIHRAEMQAELEHKKAIDKIKQEIIDVSGILTEKMLEREVDTSDHSELIDSFIEKIGDNNDGNQ